MTDPTKPDPILATKLAQVLDWVRIKPRVHPRPGQKSSLKWRMIGVNLPPELVEELDRISGAGPGQRGRGHHIERAVRLYLYLMGCGEKWLKGDKGDGV